MIASSNTNSLEISNLTACTDYEFRVASECPNVGTSDFSETAQFMTTCVCPIPMNLDTSMVTTSSATLSWDAISSAISYELRYKLLSETTWNSQSVNASNLTLNNLTECSDYEYQVRTFCANNESDWSTPFEFAVQCISSYREVENGIDNLEILPNPFNEQLVVKFNLSESTDVTVEIFNSLGQLISKENHSPQTGASSLTIDNLESISLGVYFITVTTDRGTKVRKVIKQ